MGKLFLLFVIMPIAEISVLVNVSDSIGGWNTVGFVILTAIIGAYLVRQQGMATLNQAKQKMEQGSMPGQEMAEGLLLLIAGVLLVTPGFITDGIGFLFSLPFTRKPLAQRVVKLIGPNLVMSGGGFQQNAHFHSNFTQQSQQQEDGDVFEGEFSRTDKQDDKLPPTS